MTNTDNLLVSFNDGASERRVGTLVRDARTIYFRYDRDWLRTGFNLSPYKLAFDRRPQQTDVTCFDGLFGVFADSLPDGWGRLLLDRLLTERLTNLDEVTALDRLAYVGANGAGALTYQPARPVTGRARSEVKLDELSDAAATLLRGQDTEVLETLVQFGGSSGGARPKINVGYHPATGALMPDQAKLPAGFEHWLIKFGATGDPPDIGAIEYTYHEMAVRAGIKMTTCRLFTGESGRRYFGTKRFDRRGSERLHLHSVAGLLHDNFRYTNVDYGNVMHAAFRLTKHVGVYETVLRLAAFNVFAHNHDDHSKNISFRCDGSGNWSLAPAYDLTFSRSPYGHQSMSVAGTHRPDRAALVALGTDFGVRIPAAIVEEVRQAVAAWPGLARKNGVTAASERLISGGLTAAASQIDKR